MAIFDIYAMFPEFSVLVSSGTDSKIAYIEAEDIIDEYEMEPLGLATLIRDSHVISGKIMYLEEYIDTFYQDSKE